MVAGTENYTEQAIAAGSIDDMTVWRAYKLGVVTNLSNPKALVFFGAVFAQFIRPDMSAAWTIAVAAILLVMSLVWFSTFALIVRAASRWIAHHSAAIDIVSGLIFAVLGLVMAVEGAIELFG
ncbi:LysE family translocator [Corynebacterium tuberculostearicum]|uniref:LysE family translocator n=1 Tax=Corynebacterium tuberculostearicum TaxID=38304 RepID=UPI0038D109F6